MEYFTGSNTMLDAITNSDTLLKAASDYYTPRFEAIKELRGIDDGSLHKGNEFRRVASLVNVPLMAAMNILEPDFLKDKAKFYRWLDRGDNWRYCTYDRRNGGKMTAKDAIKMPLSALGLDMPGTVEGWDAVEVEMLDPDAPDDAEATPTDSAESPPEVLP